MESVARNPYSVTRPVFDLIPGGRKGIYDEEPDEILERLQVIENQTAEIHRILNMSIQGESDESVNSSLRSVWRVFWLCQIVGFGSLVVVELGLLASDTTKNLKFVGLGLIF